MGDTPAPKTSDYVHQGYKCDVCQKNPIVGIRYKSVTRPDWDLCENCFKNQLKGEAAENSYTAVPTLFSLLRHILRVLQVWWPLLPLKEKETPKFLRNADLSKLPDNEVATYA